MMFYMHPHLNNITVYRPTAPTASRPIFNNKSGYCKTMSRWS